MADRKSYLGCRTLFRVKCVDYEDSVFLNPIWYDVIKQKNTQYLIRFKSGGANWYKKSRFQGRYYPK